MSDKDNTAMRDFVLDWLDNNEGDFDEDDACFYALSQAVSADPTLPKIGQVDLRKLYNAEKGERE